MQPAKPLLRRCAIYTRKSSEEGLEQNFNSLHAQREASEAFIKSQASEGWRLVKTHYDDGGISGASMERPALQNLLGDIRQGLIEVVVVYKVDRLTRSLADFAKVVEMVCKDCQKECEKWPKVAECKACGDSCKTCAEECRKAAA